MYITANNQIYTSLQNLTAEVFEKPVSILAVFNHSCPCWQVVSQEYLQILHCYWACLPVFFFSFSQLGETVQRQWKLFWFPLMTLLLMLWEFLVTLDTQVYSLPQRNNQCRATQSKKAPCLPFPSLLAEKCLYWHNISALAAVISFLDQSRILLCRRSWISWLIWFYTCRLTTAGSTEVCLELGIAHGCWWGLLLGCTTSLTQISNVIVILAFVHFFFCLTFHHGR